MSRSRRVPVSIRLGALMIVSLVLSGAGGAHRPGAPKALSVHAALARCARSHKTRELVTVVGYFRHGPVLNGPTVLTGALFDSDRVPADAAQTQAALRYNHGLAFGVGMRSRL